MSAGATEPLMLVDRDSNAAAIRGAFILNADAERDAIAAAWAEVPAAGQVGVNADGFAERRQDPREEELMAEAMAAAPENLGLAYLDSVSRLELLAGLQQRGMLESTNLFFGNEQVTPSNVGAIEGRLRERRASFSTAIRRRAFSSVGLAGRYDTHPCGGEPAGPFESGTIDIAQDEFSVSLVLREESGFDRVVRGVLVEETLVAGEGDPAGGAYMFGVIRDGRIELRTLGGSDCALVLTRRETSVPALRRYAQFHDPAGDTRSDPRVEVSPDLLFGAVEVGSEDVTFKFRLGAGTFDSETTHFALDLDVDQNAQTGVREGYDYYVFIDSGDRSAGVGRVQGTSYTIVGGAPVRCAVDGCDVTVPLALLGDDDGRVSFRLRVYSRPATPLVFDAMPDGGLPPASVP